MPGGLGVFDGAILLGLQPYMPAAEVVGALLVFRLYYYIVPLFISGALFAGFEIGQRRGVLARFTAVGRGTETLEVPAIASLVALVGALLIFLGALPVPTPSSRPGPAGRPRSPRTSPRRWWGRCCWSWPTG